MANLLPRRLEYLWERRDRIDHRLFAGFQYGSGAAVYLGERERAVHTYITGVSGSGKSRFLQALLFQDIAKGHPLCLIDPMGDLYRSVRDYLARLAEDAIGNPDRPKKVLDRYILLDLSEPNGVRLNPLEPLGTETSEQQAEDLLRVLERFFRISMEEMKRLRNILKGAFVVTAELNRLPAERRQLLPPNVRAEEFPLTLFFAVDFLNMTDAERKSIFAFLPEETRLRYRRQFEQFYRGNTPGEKSRLLQSSFNALPYFLDDTEVLKVLGASRSTIHLEDVLRTGKTLLCHLPIGGNLAARHILGRFITTKLQQAAYRRPEKEWSNTYYLYLDEFHHFTDEAFAEALTNLRKFGLRVTNAHQSQTQPPFNTPEGQALLNTIKANSRTKVVFQLARADAEVLAKDLFLVTAPTISHISVDETETYAQTRTASIAYTFAVTDGTAVNWSRSSAETLGQTKTMGLARVRGTNIGETLSRGLGGSMARSLSESISRSESEGITEVYNEALQMSVAIGKNWSQMRDRRRSLNLSRVENAVFAEQRGWDRGETANYQRSDTNKKGWSREQSESQGTNLMHGENGNTAYYDSGFPSRTIGQNSSEARVQSAARSQGENYARAIALMEGVARALSEKQGQTASAGLSVHEGRALSDSLSSGQGGSLTETESRNFGASLGKNSTQGRTVGKGKGTTETESWQDTLAQAFSLLDQVSKTYSDALQESWSTSQTIGGAQHRDVSRAEQRSEAEALGYSASRTRHPVYLTLEEKREIAVTRLQGLNGRLCYLSTQALEATLLETPFIADEQYPYRTQNFPRLMLELQRQRLEWGTPAKELKTNVVPLETNRPKDDLDDEKDWPFEG